MFKITNFKNQIFIVNQSDINIYLIQKKISSILTAAKTDTKSKLKSKLKLNSKLTDFSINNDNDEIKKNLFMK